jgi:hypothetical protein
MTNTLAVYSSTGNAANELTQDVSDDGKANFSYNTARQLSSVTGRRTESYPHDDLGNRPGRRAFLAPGFR